MLGIGEQRVFGKSLFHLLKTELVHHENYKTKTEANQSIFEYGEVFYNIKRLHSANAYLLPVEHEAKMLPFEMAA